MVDAIVHKQGQSVSLAISKKDLPLDLENNEHVRVDIVRKKEPPKKSNPLKEWAGMGKFARSTREMIDEFRQNTSKWE